MVESLAQLGGIAVLSDARFAGRLPLFGGIDKARFRRQVVPGEVLDLEVTLGRLSARAGTGRGRATVDGQLACEAELLFVHRGRLTHEDSAVMRIATWNVNSLNARLPRVEEWIDYARPDVLCMQETKLADAAFPAMAFAALGYESASPRRRAVERRGHRQPGGSRRRGPGLRRPGPTTRGRRLMAADLRRGAGPQRVRPQRA